VSGWTARQATTGDASVLARLLHDFNTEFDTPSPGVELLTERLSTLLASGTTWAAVVGEPAIGCALVTLRTNVWFTGPVALLDEMYVEPSRRDHGAGSALIAELLRWAKATGVGLIEINVDAADTDTMRFYRRHGFSDVDPDTKEPAFYFSLEL
jgi:GNAT superfamily N-acetyltransferase